MGSSVRRSAQCPVDRLLFLLFVRVVLPASAQEASFGRSPRGRRSVVTKNSCRPHFHCAEWSCVVLSGSPRHHIGSGTNWPVKSATRKEAWGQPFGIWESAWCAGVIYEYRDERSFLKRTGPGRQPSRLLPEGL